MDKEQKEKAEKQMVRDRVNKAATQGAQAAALEDLAEDLKQ